MPYRWDLLIHKLAHRRTKAGEYLGLTFAELVSAGREASVLAQRSWRSDGGRRLSSWVYFKVETAISEELRQAARQLHDDPDGWEEEYPPEPEAEIKLSLYHLRAKLPDDDWTLLWLRHAEQWKPREIAQLYGQTPNAISKRLVASRKKARTILGLDPRVEIGAAPQ